MEKNARNGWRLLVPSLLSSLVLSPPLWAVPENNASFAGEPAQPLEDAVGVPDSSVLLAFSGIVVSLAQGPEAQLEAFLLLNLGLRGPDREAVLEAARQHLAYVDQLTEQQRQTLCNESFSSKLPPSLSAFVERSAGFDAERNLKSLAFFQERMERAAGRDNLRRIVAWADRRIRPSLTPARFDAEGFLRENGADIGSLMSLLCGH